VSEPALKETAVPYGSEENQSPYEALAEELYREEVLDARRMSPEEKLILGERLFRWACAITLEGIRFQNPDASEALCQQILRERIALGKAIGTL
jgi:hypothetical protein